MTITLDEHLAIARDAIVASNPLKAFEHIEAFGKAAEETSLDADDKERFRELAEELNQLAAAAFNGAQLAVGRVQAIIRAASNLQVYNEAGERKETSIVAKVPQRF